MRALAHPVRLALLDHLGHSGPATATGCSDVVSLSPSATSYHLRALARVGLVEEAPGRGDGRERLWRRTAGRVDIGMAGHGPELSQARQGVLESLLSWDQERTRRYLAHLDDEPPEWQEAALFMTVMLEATAAEMQALRDALDGALAPFRRGARPQPPVGSRAVSAVIKVLPS